MICFPNAKINIGLHITRKRSDGFHDLETIFYPVPWCDALEIIPQKESTKTIYTSGGSDIPGNSSSNLCLKAFDILNQDYNLPPVRLHLHKIIPMGAGLGGGSSDGAFTLKMLNILFKLGISEDRLEEYAIRLGSDCPFFIRNKPVFAYGRGEKFESLDLKLTGYHFLLVKPPQSVSTKEAFSNIIPAEPPVSLKELIQLPVGEWKEHIHNDFEKTVFPLYPVIGELKNTLYSMGAIYASMSGSGSSVYGIFKEKTNPGDWFSGCEVFQS